MQSKRIVFAVLAALAVGSAVITPPEAMGGPCACPGDCNLDCLITDQELRFAIRTVFDAAALDSCLPADGDGDGRVVAAEVLRIASARLAPPQGCAIPPTPTRTSTPTLRPTSPATATPTAIPPTAASPTPTVPPTRVAARWLPLPPLAEGARQEVGVAAVGSVIYVIGGFLPAVTGTSRVEAYDVERGEWASVASLPIRAQHVAAVALDGFVYSMGGFLGDNFGPTYFVFRYDPSRDEWQPRASLPGPRGAGAAAVVGGRIHFVGGTGPFGTAAGHFAYDPVANEWEVLESLPVGRNHLAAAAVDGVLYVVGGRSPLSARLDRWDPGAGWTNLAPMPTARAGLAAAAVGGRLVVMGGEGNAADPQGIFPQVEIYDPASGAWTALDDMAVPRHGIGAATVGDLVYVPGGATVQGFAATDYFDALRLGE